MSGGRGRVLLLRFVFNVFKPVAGRIAFPAGHLFSFIYLPLLRVFVNIRQYFVLLRSNPYLLFSDPCSIGWIISSQVLVSSASTTTSANWKDQDVMNINMNINDICVPFVTERNTFGSHHHSLGLLSLQGFINVLTVSFKVQQGISTSITYIQYLLYKH